MHIFNQSIHTIPYYSKSALSVPMRSGLYTKMNHRIFWSIGIIRKKMRKFCCRSEERIYRGSSCSSPSKRLALAAATSYATKPLYELNESKVLEEAVCRLYLNRQTIGPRGPRTCQQAVLGVAAPSGSVYVNGARFQRCMKRPIANVRASVSMLEIRAEILKAST